MKLTTPWRKEVISTLEASLNDLECLRLSIAGDEYDADQAGPVRDGLSSIEDKINELVYSVEETITAKI